ncbi:MAG: ABC transporter ATP-binding protein [Dehalococcoidia bacterium]
MEGVNLAVGEHDFLGVIGPNGGGKSTLLKVILGLIRPQRGVVTVLGNLPDRIRNRIGYVAQHSDYDRDFPVSVMEVVLMGRYGKRGMLKPYNGSDREAAEKVLARVGMLSHAHSQIGQLSGGQQQRTFIARALVSDPALLLLDEPTASVDSAMQTDFYELLEELKKEMAIIMVSHDIGAVSVFVDKIACLNVQLYYHGSREITSEILEATYKCPVQLIAHGDIPHRVLREH